MESGYEPVSSVSSSWLKLVLQAILIFSTGCYVGAMWSLDSSFMRVSSFASKASNTSDVKPSYHELVTTEVLDAEEDEQDDGKFKYENGTIRNLRLAFIGDSVTRHQYISLVCYLHTGRWIENTDNPSPLNEIGFGSFQNFFSFSSDTVLGSTESCDCFRAMPFSPWHVFENRYYAENDNYISIFLKLGEIPSQGHWEPGTVYDVNRTHFENATDYVPPLWQYNWQDLILHHIAKLEPKPDVLVMNAGLWSNDLVPEVFEAIRNVSDSVGIKAIYSTTTKTFTETDTNLLPHDVNGCKFLEYCLDHSWTGNVSKDDEHYRDNLHFRAGVNRVLVEQLLDLLVTIL
jgi:hypothetical protein